MFGESPSLQIFLLLEKPIANCGNRYTSIAFGILSMVCSLLIPNTARFQTNRVAVAL